VPRGLAGVVVAETSVGDVRGTEGFYHYRQYNAVELAEKRTIEDVWHLLFFGTLPTRAEREAFLDQLKPKREVPDSVKGLLPAIAQYQISTIDHGFNASTFTARVITSTGADLGSAVVGAIGALSGPLHGGAPSRALDMLDAIGKPENAEKWIRNAVEKGDKIMGFGHRVYKTDDPRSLMLRGVAERLGGDNVEFAKQVERTVVDTLAELKPGRKLYANVEFYAGVVMD